MSDRRLLGFFWLVGALALWIILGDLIDKGLLFANLANPKLSLGSLETSDLYAAVATIGVAIGTWKHKVVYAFCIETVQETRKVVWPTKQETRDHTVVVVITSFIFAFILWGFDQVWKQLFSLFLEA